MAEQQDHLDLELLEACQEAESRQHEMLPLLAAALGVRPHDVFYTWSFRRCPQHGSIPETDWAYFFHGHECDLINTVDGRVLRLDFGPGGCVDTMTAWGMLEFIMTSKYPWPEFADLKREFAKSGPPHDRYSGDFSRFCRAWERLERAECLEAAALDLVEFERRFTHVGPDGIQRVCYPPETPETRRLDCAVAHRQRLGAAARHLLHKRRARSGHGG